MKKTILSLLLSCTLLTIAVAQAPKKPAAVAAKPAINFEYALNDPLNARIYTLKNGLKVYLSVYKNAPRIQTYIAVRAGSKNDPADATGLAHYLEHMVFKGTDVYGTKDFAKEQIEISKIENLYELYRKTKDDASRKKIYHQIDSISGVAADYAIANEYDKMLAGIGANGTNAFTSFDQTVYVNDIPSNQIDNWLKIEAERFRKPVLRLFHTELEAVYEEKNRGLDSDNNKMWEETFAGLFQNHTYGTQTTIGTIEHLKNPSMVAIRNYYNKNYVPNNMAIVMSGDFDPEAVLKSIEKNFGSMPTKAVAPYKFAPEKEITSKIVKTVVGPNPESVVLAWRVGGEGSKDADICNLLSGMLNNNVAGLMDINLNQAQKVLSSNCFYYPLKDYGIFVLSGEPKEGQTLEDVEKLLLTQLELIKKGNYAEWLSAAVVTDLKLRKTKELENNSARADAMLNAFVNDQKWQYSVDGLKRISKITKQEIGFFSNVKFKENNYVVTYKRIGKDTSVVKVEKPAITPVEVDRDNSSQFVKDIQKSTPPAIAPRFIDYSKDITKFQVKTVPVYFNENTENKLFELYYRFDMGSNNNAKLPLAVHYIPYLATQDMTAAQIKEEMYKLGCSYNVFIDNETVWVSLSGLNDNFEKAAALFEKMLAAPKVEQAVLDNLVSDVLKERADAKLQKRIILNRALLNYARYGATNPFKNILSEAQLKAVTPAEIAEMIKGLTSYDHKILYYGPQTQDNLTSAINAFHKVPDQLKPVPAPANFVEQTLGGTVLVVDYDMKQAEIMMLSNGEKYNPSLVPAINLYNNYFGGGMSGVVFQDLRESKALAYSTFSRYNLPNRLYKSSFNLSYIGSQADKLAEAIKGMTDLLDNMPRADASFGSAKEMILQEISSQRINKSEILFNCIDAETMGLTQDIRKNVFETVQKMTYDDILTFQNTIVKNKPRTILVLGKKENLDLKVLEQYGAVKFLSLEEIFGY
jgi:predicted Zn-dependent peptidase